MVKNCGDHSRTPRDRVVALHRPALFENSRLIRFAVVGAGATATYFIISLAAIRAGLTPLLAHAAGYGPSLAVSYFGQKIVSFGVRGGHRRFGPRFAIATALLAAGQTLLVIVLARQGVAPLTVFGVSAAAYPAAAFALHSAWTFRPSPPQIGGAEDAPSL